MSLKSEKIKINMRKLITKSKDHLGKLLNKTTGRNTKFMAFRHPR